MRKSTTRSLLAVAAATAVLLPYAADSGPCADQPAARDLYVTSYTDGLLNRPKGEDTNFFIRSGGVPNIMVLVDTSGSMNRLPPDGPGYYGGQSPALPPGYFISDPTSGAQQQTAWSSASRVVGCGVDTASSGNATFTGSGMYKALGARRFAPPCNNAVNPALITDVYQGQSTDYAAQMTVCPYFTSSNNLTLGAPGFDPDYHNATDPMATAKSSNPNFFGRDLVYHDSVYLTGLYSRYSNTTTYPFGHDFGGGFQHDAVAPALVPSSGQNATIATFCKSQGTRTQGGVTHESICNTCLTTKGWYYDGVLLSQSENSVTYRYPSIWYSGNYLNFFPPKFLVAKKVLKDIIAVQSRVRMGMATFNSSSSGATFIQPFNPTCDMPDTSNFDSNRASYVSEVDKIEFDGGTPLAVSLFDIGRYYHSPDAPWFGNTWEKATNTGMESSSNKNAFAVCYSCQVSAAILMTDGQPGPNDGDTLPAGGLTTTQLAQDLLAGNTATGIRSIGDSVCPNQLCTHFGDYRDNLAKVAFYMNKMDLRTNSEVTVDCQTNSGDQAIDTYTLGFGTGSLPNANTILANAAEAGGGRFIPAEDTKALKEGFFSILEEINGRSTSFSVATVSTLQTTSGRSVVVPRFDPTEKAIWEGHLSRFDLYSEFVNLCVPNGLGDLNCDGRCDGIYLQDQDGAYISEDGNGFFMKNDPPNKPTCLQAPACGTDCAVTGSAPADPYWNASEAWGDNYVDTKQGWKGRNVWTVVDKAPVDGLLDANDDLVKLDPSDDTEMGKLIPYLGLGGGGVCNSLAARLTQVQDLVGATAVDTSQLECTKAIVRYVLGADLFNERGKKTGFPAASQDALWDRPSLLGDIFHSSPVIVKAPSPRKGILTKLGLEAQSLLPLWESPTLAGYAGWDEYSLDPDYVNRRQLAVVGGNAGMLHAFSDSVYCPEDDDRTSDLDESELGGYYEPRTAGGNCTDKNVNTEIWAFVPPDLLPKLPLLVATEHHFFVDGSPMVRDVWVDGTSNDGVTGVGTLDGKKQGNEFHTVVVTGERRGGTRYFALDITDATEPDTAPRFLWIYPQPKDRESLQFGETYNDFLPTPPPIGPVRIAAGAAKIDGVTPEYLADGSNTPYNERWIVFLNGGFDPQYLRGRGVHMVDVWTGKELWDFSYPDGSTVVAADDPRWQLRFPVPAPVGMMRWGTAEKMPDYFEPRDNFFDTATFGDAGGQVWTLRFHVPGLLGTDGKVTNWYGARSFQLGSTSAACKLCGGQPFFQITAAGPTPSDRIFRTYLGTGDRFNLTDKYGGTCGPSNIRACVLRGCTVTLRKDSNYLSIPGVGLDKAGLSQAACNALTLDAAKSSTPLTACGVDANVKVEITNCPSPVPNNGLAATTREARVTCTELTDGYECRRALDLPGVQLTLSQTANAPTLGNWFFSIRTFRDGPATDPLSKPVFVTPAEAKTYDAHRGWVTQSGTTRAASSGVVLIDSTSAAPATVAAEDAAGWAMYYNHLGPVTIDQTSVNVSWMDERTASGTNLRSGIVAWNTVQPPLSTVVGNVANSCAVSKCKQTDRQVNHIYGADPVTGGLSAFFKDAAGTVVRSISSYRLVPAQSLQTAIFINKKGEIQEGSPGVATETGAYNVGAGETVDPVFETDVLVIDKELYTCRHADSPVCK